MRKFILGIDLGATIVKIGLLDKDYRIKKKKRFFTQDFKDRESLIQRIIEEIKQILKENRIDVKDIIGVGLGLPGPVDFKKGKVFYFPNIKGFKNVPLGRIVQRKTGIKTYVDNDTNLAGLAENRFGKGRGFRDAVFLTLGTGVGGAVFVEGKIYRGKNFTAGEIGHIPINEEGPICNCGGKACLERYIGNRYILAKAKKIFKKRDLTLEVLSQMAKRKNKKALFIWKDVGRKLGIALTGIVNFFNPECIIIGGGLAQAGEVLFSEVRRTINARAMRPSLKGLKILRARLGVDAGILGAAILARERGR